MSGTHRLSRVTTTLLVLSLCGGMAAGARAQEAGHAGPDQPLTEPGEEIVITGSLIEQPISLVSLPVTILDRTDLETASIPSTGDILQELPSQGNALNDQFNNGGDGTTRVNLRGLGNIYTLVLLNGRRYVPSGDGLNDSVDLNAIPVHVIERIEVLKDGGSPLYGSGAIGGVVNIITRTDFDGVESSAYLGFNPSLGRPIYDLGVGASNRTERGLVAVSAGYFDHPPLDSGARGFSRADTFHDWSSGETFSTGSTAAPQGYIGIPIPAGEPDLTGNDLWRMVVTQNQGASALIIDPASGSGWRAFDGTGNSDTGDGDLYNSALERYLIMPSRRMYLHARAEHDVGSQVQGYVEGFYNYLESSARLAATPLYTDSEGITVSADNIYNPFGRLFSDIRMRMVGAGPRITWRSRHTLQLFVGLEGRLPEDLPLVNDWRWDLSYGFGRSENASTYHGDLRVDRLAESLGPSFVQPDGTVTCGTPNAPIAGCVPLNLFGGEEAITPEMLEYIAYAGTVVGNNQLQQLLLTASGTLWGTRQGPRISLAVGAEYKQQSGALRPDSSLTSGETTIGTREPSEDAYDTREAYAELAVIPVVGGLLARRLELAGAARITSVREYRPFTTWHARGAWAGPFGLSLHAGHYRAFRIPDPREPLGGSGLGSGALPAPGFHACNGRDAFVEGPELGAITQLGAGYRPPFLPGLGLELNHFRTRLRVSIHPDSPCLVPEPPYDVLIDTRAIGPETTGVDFAARYRFDSLAAGSFGLDWEGTWLQRFDFHTFDGAPIRGRGIYDLGMYPEWKLNLSASWWSDQWEANARIVYIGGFEECQYNDCKTDQTDLDPDAAPLVHAVSAWANIGFSVAYSDSSPLGTSKLTLGVSNIFDGVPPTIYNGFLATSDASTYDFLGRFVYARLEQRF
jgi:iron complex outermembrane receptor protein